MGKVKRDSIILAKSKLKTNIIKRKSLKPGTPIPKKLTLKQIKENMLQSPKVSPKFLINEDLPESESDISVYETETGNETIGQFVRAPNSNNIDTDQIKSGVKALFECILKTTGNKTELFDEEQPIFLQVTAVKVPKTPNRQVRLLLKHSLLSEHSDICLIVKDIGNPKDYDETILHYQRLLIDHDITKIKTIMPYHQFKSEYANQFELKRTFMGLYDYFLVDGRISGYVVHLLGKIFFDKRKMPTSIKMDASNLKEHIDKSLRKTIMKIHSKGDSYLVQVGHSKMTEEEVLENVWGIIDELTHSFPGSLDNIRQLGLKTEKGFTIPIYLTLKKQSAINVPVVKSKRPKEFKSVTGELTTYLNRDVTVLPSGKIILIDKNKKTKNDTEDNQEFPDSDFLDEEEDLELYEDNEEKVPESDILNSSDEADIIPEITKRKGGKKQIEIKEDEKSFEEDNLIEVEQMYLNEYEQKKVNTVKQKKKMQDNSESTVNKATSKKQKKIKKPMNKNIDKFAESDILKSNELDDDNAKNVEQLQIMQQQAKSNKKQVKPKTEKAEKPLAKSTQNVSDINKNIRVTRNKKIQQETVHNGTSTENQSTAEPQTNILGAVEGGKTVKRRKKRKSPLENENTNEDIPTKKNKKIPEVTENPASKKQQVKTNTRVNIEGKDITKEVKDQGKKKKGIAEQAKNKKMESNVDKNSNTRKPTTRLVNATKQLYTVNATEDNGNKKAGSAKSKRPTKNIKEVNNTEEIAKQTTQKNGRRKQKMENLASEVNPSTFVEGKKTKVKDASEIPNKKIMNEQLVVEIKNKKGKSETNSKKNADSQKKSKIVKKVEVLVETDEHVVKNKKGGKERKTKK